MPFNDNPSARIPGVPRGLVLRQLILYFLPWPKGTIQGPPEAFHTEPGNWSDDLATLKKLVEQGKINSDEVTVAYITGSGLKTQEALAGQRESELRATEIAEALAAAERVKIEAIMSETREKIGAHDIEMDAGPGIHLGTRDTRESV